MKGFRKIRISKADALWSKLVRERDKKCLYCGERNYIQAHHLFGRGRSRTRFNLLNGFTLCSSHHAFSFTFSAHRTEQTFKIWAKKYLGEQTYEILKEQSEIYQSRSKAIQEFMEEHAPEEIKPKSKECRHRMKPEWCGLCMPRKKKKVIKHKEE